LRNATQGPRTVTDVFPETSATKNGHHELRRISAPKRKL